MYSFVISIMNVDSNWHIHTWGVKTLQVNSMIMKTLQVNSVINASPAPSSPRRLVIHVCIIKLIHFFWAICKTQTVKQWSFNSSIPGSITLMYTQLEINYDDVKYSRFKKTKNLSPRNIVPHEVLLGHLFLVISDEISLDLAIFCEIRWDMVRFSKIWWDSMRYGEIWCDSMRNGEIL